MVVRLLPVFSMLRATACLSIIATLLLGSLGHLAALEAPAAAETVVDGADGSQPFISDEVWLSAPGAKGAEAAVDRRSERSDSGATLTRMLVGLVVVIALALAAGWLVRRSGLHRRMPGTQGKHMQILETLPLGNRRQVSLITVGDRVVVLAHGDQAITSVCELSRDSLGDMVQPDPEPSFSDAAKTADVAQSPKDVQDFQNRLAQLLGRSR
jgi:flagellar biosynthetic protein FliO